MQQEVAEIAGVERLQPRLIGGVERAALAVGIGFGFDGIRDSRLRNRDGTFSDEVRYALVNPRYKSTGTRRATSVSRSTG